MSLFFSPHIFSVRTQAPGVFRVAGLAWLLAAFTVAGAQQEKPKAALPQVTVAGASTTPVEKSFRKMIQGMDYFERARAATAPEATLRFRLLPRKPGTDMNHLLLEVTGTTFDYEVPIAPDHTFVLERNPRALQENATVSTNRKRLSMTWRTEIRTPGWPAGTRRLGDLRLECLVGMEADLVSNNSLIGGIAKLFVDSKAYCDRVNPQYLYFAERPLFGVTLVWGARREALPIHRLYATAVDDPQLKDDLPYCDCEVLIDRTYFLPLGDHSWPNDTRVEFDYMDERP